MPAIDELFNKMADSQEFTEKIVAYLTPPVVASAGSDASMLLGHMQSLQVYHNITRQFPDVAQHIHYNELIPIIQSKICSMEDSSQIQDMLYRFKDDLLGFDLT